MGFLTSEDFENIIAEIQGSAEVDRRARAKRRHEIYNDGGKRFLVEQVEREFDAQAVPEMRLAPISILRKMVNKRSVVYKQAPTRKANGEKNQALVDHYVAALKLNVEMQKANRYFNLFSNTALYTRPNASGELKLNIVPPFMYSVLANPVDQTMIDGWIFSSFIESGSVAPSGDVSAATGVEGFSRNRAEKTADDRVDSEEFESGVTRSFIFWSKEQHATLDDDGVPIALRPDLGDEQYLNPIELTPVVNLAKDRDNEPWATQGEDAVDLCVALMLGWTDLLTIAKHQGFSILTIVSEEEPKQLKIGVSKAVWLRQTDEKKVPSISYVQAASPLAQYKDLLMDLLALTLSSNDMPPNSIGGSGGAKTFTSGFHALIEMSDVLEAVEADKPKLHCAEQELWQVIKAWHNYLFDQGSLADEAKALGKFSDDFAVEIIFADIKPIESESERIQIVKDLTNLGLMTRKDALRKLYPDMSDEQIDEKLLEIDAEASGRAAKLQAMLGQQAPAQSQPEPNAAEDDGNSEESPA